MVESRLQTDSILFFYPLGKKKTYSVKIETWAILTEGLHCMWIKYQISIILQWLNILEHLISTKTTTINVDKGLVMQESSHWTRYCKFSMKFIISNVASVKFVHRHQACFWMGDKLAFLELTCEACISILMRNYSRLAWVLGLSKLWRLIWDEIFQGQYKYWLALAC